MHFINIMSEQMHGRPHGRSGRDRRMVRLTLPVLSPSAANLQSLLRTSWYGT